MSFNLKNFEFLRF
uniref:Uncharacterized protein n=1 Tax=Anguilla anguilla TaxID=7936 RepID=A0A0E9W074_ANGAN